MQLVPLAASILLASVAEAEHATYHPNWLAWHPHDSSDAEKLISNYDAELTVEKAEEVAAHEEAASKPQHAAKPLSLAKTKEEKPMAAVDDDPYGVRSNAQLQAYFGGSKALRAGHATFSTSWHVEPKRKDHKLRQHEKHIPQMAKKQDSGDRYLAELYGLPVDPPAEAKGAVKAAPVAQVAAPAAGHSFGRLIDGPLRDAVVQAAAWEAEDPRRKPSGMSEVLRWTAPLARKPALSSTQVHSEVKSDFSIQSQDAANKAAAERGNTYMFDLLSEKDQVQLEAQAAEKVTPKASKKGNGYLDDIIPASMYVSS